MSVSSFAFAGFVLVVAGVYYALPRRAQNLWLLLASYAFYGTWAWHFPLILLLLSVANWSLGRAIGAGGRTARWWLWLGIGVNLLALVAFRTAGFYVPQLLDLMQRWGMPSGAGALQVIVPVGISFRVLENIAYLVDVSRGQMPPATSFVELALYQAYFPKLLSGPIERARSFLPRLARPRAVDNDRLARSLTLMIAGAVRKLVIADTLVAAIPVHIFQMSTGLTGIELSGWLIVYAFALYNDFAGYTSLMRGVSGLFGIDLSPNFRWPFFARSFSDFWNRWHTTLSHWLRDYVFFPLGRWLLQRDRNRYSPANLVIPPLTTMCLSGLWHGFSWNMLVWGGLHGLYQVFDHLLALWRGSAAPAQWTRWERVFGPLAVFVLVTLAWIPFRMELPQALEYLRGLLTWTSLAIVHRRLYIALALVLLAAGVDWIQYRQGDELVFLRWPRPAQALLLAACLFAVVLVTPVNNAQPFVYQGF